MRHELFGHLSCENYLCVYCRDRLCQLEEITLDVQGSCRACIYILPDEETLQREKDRIIGSWVSPAEA